MKMVIPPASELSLPQIPPAVYRARITDHTYKTTSTDKPAMQLKMQILTQGPDPKVKTVGRTIVDLITITEDSLWRVNMPFKAATGNDLPEGKEFSVEELINFVMGQMRGKDVIITVAVEQYQGEPRTRIKSYQPVTD